MNGFAGRLNNRFRWIACVGLLLLAPLPAMADQTIILPLTATPSGTVTSPTEALTDNGTGAQVSSSNSELVLSAFPNTDLGTITDVTIWVDYLTTATPGNDEYQFDVAIDDSFFSLQNLKR